MLKLIIVQPIPKIISIKLRVKLKLKSILSSSFDKLKDLDVTSVEIVIRIINSITTLANKKKTYSTR